MDVNKVAKRRSFIINIAFLALILLLAFLFLEYVLGWIMPFLLGFLIAAALRPVIRLVSHKTKLPKRFCAFVLVLLGYGLIGFLLWLIGNHFFQDIKEFCLNLPTFYNQEILPFLESANQGLLNLANFLSPDLADQIGNVLSSILNSLQSSLLDISANVLSGLAGASTKVPLLFISLIFTILSSLFISMDYDGVLAFIKRQIPEKNKVLLRDIRSYLGKTLFSYCKAYSIILLITFIELSVGFLALRIENPFGIAAITAAADILPVIGTGTILLPWALIALFQQRVYMALGLLLLYLIITAVRHFVEPKIVSDQLGLPPIVSLLCIYLGFVWFGVLGIFLFPITMNILILLHRTGKIHLWK